VHDISPRHAFQKFRAFHSASVGVIVIVVTFTILILPPYVFLAVIAVINVVATILALKSN
jgi:hypothetical protein